MLDLWTGPQILVLNLSFGLYTLQVPELVSGGLDLWTEPQILVLNFSFGLYSTSPRAGSWRVGSMDRTSNSGFEPFFWPLLYTLQVPELVSSGLDLWTEPQILVPELVSGGLDLWTEPQVLVLHLSFGLYSTSPRAGFWRVGSMDRTSNSGFAPFCWPLLYKSQSWFLAGWIYGQNLKFWFCTFLLASTLQVPELVSGGLDLWTEPQILVLNLSFGLYPTSPRV